MYAALDIVRAAQQNDETLDSPRRARGFMDRNTEQVLIVYAVDRTSDEDLKAAEEAIRVFERPRSSVGVRPRLFDLPDGAAPGATLGTELTDQLRSCIGAVVFVDDLRPNVAYEIGFFHGQGRTVLLLTRERVDSVWTAISDLAGAALAPLEREDIRSAVHRYLARLYDDLGFVGVIRSIELPSESENLLRGFEVAEGRGPWGQTLILNSWEAVDLDLGLNLLPNARFKIVLRALDFGADYVMYHRVRFGDRDGIRRKIWLGLSSRRMVAGLSHNERTLPAHAPTEEWRVHERGFEELLRKGSVLGSGAPEFLETVRFRAGAKSADPGEIGRIEIGFFGLSGIDR